MSFSCVDESFFEEFNKCLVSEEDTEEEALAKSESQM